MVEMDPARYVQLDFFSMLPGSAGGRALLAQRGIDHFKHLASLSARRPKRERVESAQSASTTRTHRRHTLPRTRTYIELDEQVTERVVPYWPHTRHGRQRSRPLFVRIEVSRERISGDMTWLYDRLQARTVGEIQNHRSRYKAVRRRRLRPPRPLRAYPPRNRVGLSLAAGYMLPFPP